MFSALTAAVFTLFPFQVAQVAGPVVGDAVDTPEAAATSTPSPVVRVQQQQPRQQPRQRRATPQPKPKSPFLELFWRLFPPPGDYNLEIGVNVGANFLETAYGGINPNVVFRGQVGFRPQPRRAPLVVYGLLDYSDYEQQAGDLRYMSRYIGVGGGGGLLAYYGPLRFEATGELGMITRVATQSDGVIDPVTNVHVQPFGGVVLGGGLALGGRVSLSLRGVGRWYGFPVRRDVMVLYGVEILLGGRPVDYY